MDSKIIWQHDTDKIVTCSTCKGSGIIEKKEMADYHKNEYKCWNEFCPSCDGYGRKVLSETKIRYEVTFPSGSDLQDITHAVLSKMNGRTTTDIYDIENVWRE